MIQLPEIDERIYELFGDTDLVESGFVENGYIWSPMAIRFVEFLEERQFERLNLNLIPRDSVTAD